MEIAIIQQASSKLAAIGRSSSIAADIASKALASKNSVGITWKSIKGTICNLSQADQIRELLAKLPVSVRHSRLWKLNAKWMEASVNAGRSVISVDEVIDLLDPLRPLENVFTFKEHLGSGCYGSVSLWENSAGKEFAIKAIHHQDWTGILDFEVGLALDHPNIVKTHHLVTKRGLGRCQTTYVIMEYVPGKTLWNVKDSLSRSERNKLYAQLKDAVAYCANKGFVPNDLHPENIMVCSDGSIKLIDLGFYDDLHSLIELGNPDWYLRKTFDEIMKRSIFTPCPNGYGWYWLSSGITRPRFIDPAFP